MLNQTIELHGNSSIKYKSFLLNADVFLLHLRQLPGDSEDLTQELSTSLLFPLITAGALAEAYLSISMEEKTVNIK